MDNLETLPLETESTVAQEAPEDQDDGGEIPASQPRSPFMLAQSSGASVPETGKPSSKRPKTDENGDDQKVGFGFVIKNISPSTVVDSQ